MRKILLYLLFLIVVLPCAAQRKEIATAADQVKSGKKLEDAEKSMRTLLKDSANRDNAKIWKVLFDAMQKQYEQGNEKLYLKQKYDTTLLFNTAYRMFTDMETYDSIDARPDKKGRVKTKMRKQNGALLNQLRPNLYFGGLFFIGKQQYSHAYNMLNVYINASTHPMFEPYHYAQKDARLPQAAYWAAYCGYKLKDARKILNHTYNALKDTTHHESMLQLLATAYQLESDTTRYLQTLDEGFKAYPLSDFFYPHIVDYYSSQGDWDKALAYTDSALIADSTNVTVLLAKSTLLLNTADYDGCFAISSRLTKSQPDLATAWLNAGLAKFNQGVSLDKNLQSSAKTRRQILQLYTEALPFLEKYRSLQPNAKDKWGLPLYTIYLNLNKGKEFDEIDKLIGK